MEGTPVWKCRKPAHYCKVSGATLFLFKFADVEIWLCAHGPMYINDYRQFLAAQDAGKLTPAWASWDNEDVTAEGVHSWDTFDSAAEMWLGENYGYETTLLQRRGADLD